ncbi:MAG: hypothetical protein EBQ85_10650 [Proteobacteria bacterium]|nr:hypothetical protein [Pseudomonadota bacterium]
MLSILTSATTTADARLLRREVLSIHRSTPHFGRKFYHLMMGLMCFSLYAFVLNREEALLALLLIGGSFMMADVLRLKSSTMNTLILKYFGKIMRREELRSISGNSFYILGLIVVVALFSKTIVLLSVLFLAVGDPIAAIVGTQWGRHKITARKSLEGAVANFLASGFASFLLGITYLKLDLHHSLFLALLGGMVSTIVELIPAPIDDNFTIPVGSALLLSVVFYFIPLVA